jgi:hypothetical protein
LQLKAAVERGFVQTKETMTKNFETVFRRMSRQESQINALMQLLTDQVKERAENESSADITSYTVVSMPSSPMAAFSSQSVSAHASATEKGK